VPTRYSVKDGGSASIRGRACDRGDPLERNLPAWQHAKGRHGFGVALPTNRRTPPFLPYIQAKRLAAPTEQLTLG
jgi:hypothetical protein